MQVVQIFILIYEKGNSKKNIRLDFGFFRTTENLYNY
jgi:hypothetical protein